MGKRRWGGGGAAKGKEYATIHTATQARAGRQKTQARIYGEQGNADKVTCEEKGRHHTEERGSAGVMDVAWKESTSD